MRHPAAARLTIPHPITLEPAHAAEQIAAVPPSGVYALHAPPHPPYLSWSSHLRRRLTRLLVSSTSASGAIARLRDNLGSVECWPTGSRLENALLLYELSKLHYPGDYLRRLRLRIPWFIGLTSTDPFPRLHAANRISRRDAAVYGPFPNRDAALHYEQEVLGLFQIRRCTDALTPHAEHPGCIYGEMNQCLRPCQCAVTHEEYGFEAARVDEFLASNGKAAIVTLSAARDRACEDTDFEQAAQIHKRLEKIGAAASARDSVVAEVHAFHGVALTHSTEPRRFQLWPMLGGFWQDPIPLDFSAEESQPASLDRELRERLTPALSSPRSTGHRAEHLALFARWYFSSWRDGEWFPFHTVANLNYRRLVREISKMVKADAAPRA
jgi:excinuclease ABC subunit C